MVFLEIDEVSINHHVINESSKIFKPVAHGGAIALSVVFILSTQITLSQMRASSINSILWCSLASAVVMDGESGDAVTSVKAVP